MQTLVIFYMTFYLIDVILVCHNVYFSFKYLRIQKRKPKFVKLFLYDEKFKDEKDKQDLAFTNWNMAMRRSLEKFFR